MIDNYNLFQDKGHILLKQFITNNSFIEICKNLKKDILEEYKNSDKKKLGGLYMGNLGVTTGKYSKIIYNLLIENGLDKIIEEISKNKFSEFDIAIGGNLNLPGGFDQHFHTDGLFGSNLIIVQVATENVNKFNGPLEIVLNTHKSYFPYWKFFFKKNKTLKFLLSRGDIVIRTGDLWHRGTKNISKETRYLLGISLTKKKNNVVKNNFDENNQVNFISNMFKPDFFGKIREIIYTRFKYIYIFIRLIKSFFKK